MQLFSAVAILASIFTVSSSPMHYFVGKRNVAGRCSLKPASGVKYTVNAEHPGLTGVYVLPRADFDKLGQASKSAMPHMVDFHSYADASCAQGSVTDCSREFDKGTIQPPQEICIALVNSNSINIVSLLEAEFYD
jgi:hypothetical protein